MTKPFKDLKEQMSPERRERIEARAQAILIILRFKSCAELGILPNVCDDDICPEYDFTGGVRGKHYKALRQGYSVKVHQPDGTTLIQK